jgi:hypothetical protein
MHRICTLFTSFCAYEFGLHNFWRKWGKFPSHHDGSLTHIELGRIRVSDFRLAVEGKFDWYSFDKPCLVSTICIREYSNISTSFQTVQYCMCEMHRFSVVSHYFVRMTSVRKIWAENGGISPSHFEGSYKHLELGRIRVFDFRLAIEVKFDWSPLDKPCLVSTICIRENSNVFTSFQTVQY